MRNKVSENDKTSGPDDQVLGQGQSKILMI